MISKKLMAAFCFYTITITTSFAEEKIAPPKECSSVKEFMTTLNFLKSKKEFGLEEKNMVEIAKIIAGGCNGAAGRFIQTMTTLTDADIPTKDALSVAKKVSLEDDNVFSNFISIFKKVYVEKYFDLSEKKSLKIASELTIKMEKEPKRLIEDFNTLGEFCLNRNGVDLSYEKCADFILATLLNSKATNNTIGKSAINFFDFLVKDEKGPKLTTLKALKEIETLVEFGTNGLENFMQAYTLAINPNGLNLTTEKAILFAEEMARKAIKK